MAKQKTVADYLQQQEKWKDALTELRAMLLESGMEETIKWGIPVYCVNGKNVAGIGAFKNHFGIWFFNGVLLSDKHNKLGNAQEGKTKAMRQWNFESKAELDRDKDLLKKYIREAQKNQEDGKEVRFERDKSNLEIPGYFLESLSGRAKKVFDEFTYGKQKDYVEWVTDAKTEKTREKRLKQSNEWLEEGKPRNWKYLDPWKSEKN